MLIDRLELKNFRGFSDLTVDFKSLQTVILGENGSGKSSVLDALRYVLEEGISGVTAKDEDYKKFIKSQIRSGFMQFVSDDVRNGEHKAEMTIVANNSSYKLELLAKKGLSLVKPNEFMFEKRLENPETTPIFLYYNPDSFNKYNIGTDTFESNWFENLTNQANLLEKFVKWFVDEEDFENKERLEGDNDYRSPILQSLRAALNKFLGLLYGDGNKIAMTNLRTKKLRGTEPLSIDSFLVLNKGELEFNLKQLSDGEKRVLLMAVDIAKSLGRFSTNDSMLLGDGIVLIDEIDLHLHPKWQANVLGALRATFPNIQFIVTTHSPHIISRVPKEDIVLLDNFKAIPCGVNTYGRDIENILYNVFGVEKRPLEVNKRIHELNDLIDSEKNDDAKVLLNELKTLLGENDPDLIKAAVILDEYN